MLACVFRHEVFRRSFLARHASLKALRARSRRVFEHKTKQTNLTGEGGYKFKDVCPVDLGTANPYSLIAQMLRSAHEAKKSVDQNTIKPPEEINLHPDVIELIKAMVDNFEPVCCPSCIQRIWSAQSRALTEMHTISICVSLFIARFSVVAAPLL